MPFTAEELSNIANATLDYYEKGVESQVIQDRPLFNDLQANAKEFPGGKDVISERVKGVYSSSMVGYSHDDEQAYVNPANIKEAKIAWYETSSGIKVTFTELKKNGIHIVDSAFGKNTVTASDAEMVQLADLLEDKLEDLTEGSKRSFAEMLWRDGTQDSKAVPGVLSFMLETPTAGITFGLDRGVNTWWRNRANIGIDSSTPGNLNLVSALQKEMRQLRRFAKPKHKFYAGSDFMDAFEKELRSKGNFTMEGWAKTGKIDASMADLMFKGIDVQYEPLLDDLGKSKYGTILDLNSIRLRPMANEAWKMHSPARPPEQYVLYRALTWTGALTARRLNSSGIYSVL